MDTFENPYVPVPDHLHLIREENEEDFTWPTITETTDVHWTSPRIDVIVTVEPGDDISAALEAAARDEISEFVPVNLIEFDVTFVPVRDDV